MEEQERTETNGQAEPELLYHYTTQEGLLGMLDNEKIWATHIRYLNDTSEGKILFATFMDQLLSAYETIDSDILVNGLTMATWATSQNVFIASFSERKDSLSQWRAYSGKALGFSIGFRLEYLRKIGKHFIDDRLDRFYSQSEPLVRCKYYDQNEKKTHELEIETKISAFITEVKKNQAIPIEDRPENFETLGQIASRHFVDMGRESARIKDIGFCGEAEWRLAFLLNQYYTPRDLKFKPGNSVPVPYLEVPLCWDQQPIEIEEIVVGPSYPHTEEAVESVKMLLSSKGLTNDKVVPSKIPYRNW
jgi:hypothetical protein